MTSKIKPLKGIQISNALNHDVEIYSKNALPYTIYGEVDRLVVCNTVLHGILENTGLVYISTNLVLENISIQWVGIHHCMDLIVLWMPIAWAEVIMINAYKIMILMCVGIMLHVIVSVKNNISLFDYTNAFLMMNMH